jgi:hypothetical protein
MVIMSKTKATSSLDDWTKRRRHQLQDDDLDAVSGGSLPLPLRAFQTGIYGPVSGEQARRIMKG